MISKTILIPAIAAIAVFFAITTVQANAMGSEDLFFKWDPAESSSDPNNLIIVNGAFTRFGLASESTSDVQGELEGSLKGKIDHESITVQETTGGTTTITTTVNAHSQKASNLEGTISIDGEEYTVTLKPTARATILSVEDVFTSPTITQTAILERLAIPVEVKVFKSDGKEFEGFGVLREEINRTESGGTAISFHTITLEAELIGDTGFFDLEMTRLQRTVETVP